MTKHTCPVEGCDYEADQIDQLRGHINGSPDHPSWGDVRGDLDAGSELVDQNDQQETTPSEEGESPDETGDDDHPDDHPERDDEGGSEGGSAPSDAGSDEDDQQNDQNDQGDTPMPTDDELQRQRRVQGAQPDESGSDDEISQETSKTTPSKGGNEGGSATGLLPAIDTSTIIMLVAVLAVALILYRLLSGGGVDEGSKGDEEDVDDQEASSEDVDDLPNFDATDLEDLS
ncbi:hypothetical protein [Haloplanus pelagicus]|uniref:hypothetical protein n=1 Tax=Haloplanus pelagicus TaxID=2949995 RepID=UPI0020406412|nr:hypothetical protein [Haloplanus sp. HW8-1]